MKRAMKHLITLLIVAWVMLSVMYMAGEPQQGAFLKQITIGITSLSLALLLGRELRRRNLMWNESDEEGIDDEW